MPLLTVPWCSLPVQTCKQLHPSWVALQALQAAKPLTKPAGYSGTTNLRRAYERERLPAGVAVVGDAVCAFNPVSALPTAALHTLKG